MTEVFWFLLPVILMCFLLVSIHCYLGIHVLKRKIIFIDLALAQVASLGATFAMLFHFNPHSIQSFIFSFFFTVIISLYFAGVRRFEKLVPQEFMIAIVYAFAASSVVLILSSMPHGSDHIKEVLVGKILWVTKFDLIKSAVIYSVVGILFYVFREKFWSLSCNEKIERSFFWDFLFYTLFGLVITTSVSTAGILLVFSLLVIPALIGSLFAQNIKGQLLIGFLFGLFFSIIGIVLSYYLDLPAGALLVAILTFTALALVPLKLSIKA